MRGRVYKVKNFRTTQNHHPLQKGVESFLVIV